MKRKRIAKDPETGRGPGRPRDRVAHAAILQAAIDLTREVGYDALAIEAVAARAGVGKATIYRYWPNKELLMAEAVDGIVRSIPPAATGKVEGDLMIYMGATMSMLQDPATPPLLSGFIAAMQRSSLIAERIRNGFAGSMRTGMRGALERGIQRGELAADMDVGLALDLLEGSMLYRSLISGEPITEAYTREVVRRVLRAFQ
ncbi:MAG TPA: TetR/AcrR family transcriptional regulator [Gemmatimonadaceae bacterium]